MDYDQASTDQQQKMSHDQGNTEENKMDTKRQL